MINISNHKNIKKETNKIISVNCYSVLARRVYVAREPNPTMQPKKVIFTNDIGTNLDLY